MKKRRLPSCPSGFILQRERRSVGFLPTPTLPAASTFSSRTHHRVFRRPSPFRRRTGSACDWLISRPRRSLSRNIASLATGRSRLKYPVHLVETRTSNLEANRSLGTNSSTQGPIHMAQRTLKDEDRVFKRPSETMQYFHSIFEEEFNDLYDLADGSFNSKGMGLQSYLRMANQFIQHLTTHHTIEERMIFPVLAQRMPSFREDAQHVESHKGIHDGLDRLTDLVKAYRREPSAYSPTALRECLDSFREVLFNHLDQEVKDLAPEEFRKHYTAEEMKSLPFH